jgi:UDP-glucose 4-epimerase
VISAYSSARWRWLVRANSLRDPTSADLKEVIDTSREVTARERFGRAGSATAVLVAASDKIRKELGWVPQFSHVPEIIESAWRWHKANPDGYTN